MDVWKIVAVVLALIAIGAVISAVSQVVTWSKGGVADMSAVSRTPESLYGPLEWGPLTVLTVWVWRPLMSDVLTWTSVATAFKAVATFGVAFVAGALALKALSA